MVNVEAALASAMSRLEAKLDLMLADAWVRPKMSWQPHEPGVGEEDLASFDKELERRKNARKLHHNDGFRRMYMMEPTRTKDEDHHHRRSSARLSHGEERVPSSLNNQDNIPPRSVELDKNILEAMALSVDGAWRRFCSMILEAWRLVSAAVLSLKEEPSLLSAVSLYTLCLGGCFGACSRVAAGTVLLLKGAGFHTEPAACRLLSALLMAAALPLSGGFRIIFCLWAFACPEFPAENGEYSHDRMSTISSDALRLLSELKEDNVPMVVYELMKIKLDNKEELGHLIQIIFKKAILEPDHSASFADILYGLRARYPQFRNEADAKKPWSFTRVLLNNCQDLYESHPCAFTFEPTDADRALYPEPADLQAELARRKDSMLAVLKLFAHLYLRGLLATKVIGQVVHDLIGMKAPTSELPEATQIECVCALLEVCGPGMEEGSVGSTLLSTFQARLMDLHNAKFKGEEVYSESVRSMIADNIHLRQTKWKQKDPTSLLRVRKFSGDVVDLYEVDIAAVAKSCGSRVLAAKLLLSFATGFATHRHQLVATTAIAESDLLKLPQDLSLVMQDFVEVAPGETKKLHEACKEGKIKKIDCMLRRPYNPDAMQGGQATATTPLLVAIRQNQVKAVKLLVHARANVNLADGRGETPLVVAVKSGQVALIQLLVEGRVDVNKAQRNGLTPLFAAAECGFLDVVKLLLKAEADLSLADNAGQTPISVAVERGFRDVAKLFLQVLAPKLAGT
eukprot:s2259_g3.t2